MFQAITALLAGSATNSALIWGICALFVGEPANRAAIADQGRVEFFRKPGNQETRKPSLLSKLGQRMFQETREPGNQETGFPKRARARALFHNDRVSFRP